VPQPDGRGERRLLLKDLPLELAQRLHRLEAEPGVEAPAEPAELGERICLATVAVEREHQLSDRALARRLGAYEGSELGEDLVVTAERQLRVEELLVRLQPQVLQLLRELVQHARRAGDVGERSATPQRERRAQLRDPFGGRQAPRVLGEALELRGIDVELEPVARIAGDDRVAAEQAPQLGDVALQGGGSGRRRLLAPERPDQAVGRDDRARAGGEERERSPSLGAAEADRSRGILR
jgi:hypothetical protein